MADQIRKTNPLVRFLGNRLGLVTKEEITEMLTKATGVASTNRPKYRSSMIIGQSIAPDMKAEDYLKAYRGWVYACIDVIAKETADIELTLYKRKNQNQFDVVDNHPVLDLLYKVNPLYTSYLLWEATEGHLKLTGESFWWLAGPTNNPKEIWVLRPDWVSVKDSKARLVDHYEYGPPGDRKQIIPYEQMIHFKDFNPRNAFRGHGTVKGADKEIDENEFQKDHSRNFFHNAAIPAGALQTDQNIDEDQYQRIRDDWESVHKGSKNAWKVAILEAGLKWADVGLNQKEMDYIEGRRLTRDEILAMFRVPKPLLTFDDVNRAAAKEARAILLENVIKHEMSRICSFLTEFLLPRYGDEDLFFGYKNPVPNDRAADMQYYKTALGGAPWMTINEVREQEDLEPIEGGDKLMVPFSLQDSGNEKSEDQKKKDSYKRFVKGINTRIPQYPYQRHQIDQIALKIEDKLQSFLQLIIKKKRLKSEVIHKLSTFKEGEIIHDESARDAHWKTIITRTDPREAKYKYILTDQFTNQEDRVADVIEQGIKSSGKLGQLKTASIDDVEDIVLRDSDVFAGPLMDFIRTVIEAEGIQQIQSLIDNGVFFMQSTEVQKYLKKDGVKFIKAIQEETAEQLRDTLAEGISKQEGIAQLKARVTKVYEDATGYRAERIARSEVLRATNFATEEAYKQSKVVEKKEWLTAKDERTCPWCGPMDGKQLSLGSAYYEQGDTITGTNDKGKKVRMTVGVANIDTPPLHPNCRCTLIPVIDSEKSTDKTSLLEALTHATLKELAAKNSDN